MVTIQEITKPIEHNLQDFEKYLDTLLTSDIEIVEKIIKYLAKTKGKQIRPMLVIFSSMLFNNINHKSYVAAGMLELFHNATLIHDDVVDEAKERRGLSTVNSIWNNQTAVLIGDFFFAKGLISAIENKDYEFLNATSNAIKLMSEGELLQIQKTDEIDLSEETYFRIIRGKTASLIGTCCELGAIAAGADKDDIARLKDFGDNLGMAFQIRDDILDYIGKQKITGKAPGNDLKEKKLTLPIIYALHQTDDETASKYIAAVKSGEITEEQISEIIDYVIVKGGIEHSQKIAEKYINKAIEIISQFEDSVAKESLIAFAEFIIRRDK